MNEPLEANTEEDAYVPPACAWDLREFIRAPLPVIQSKIVDCSTCPVVLLCESGTGGTGYVCGNCGLTGVWVDEKQDEYLVVDCGRHKFHTVRTGGSLTRCDICSGQAIAFVHQSGEQRMHYVLTVHSRIGAELRQERLREAFNDWHAAGAEQSGVPQRVDRPSWARAVKETKVRWGFKGIRRIYSGNGWYGHQKLGTLYESLIHDERYCDKLAEDETRLYLDADWDGDWRERCEHQARKEGYEPSESEFGERVQELFENEDRRWQWAANKWDWDFVRDWLKDCCEDEAWIAEFLKEHPVDEVQRHGTDGEILSLDEVAGFCPECDEPLTQKELGPAELAREVEPHPFPGPEAPCQTCGPDGGTIGCVFERDGKPRTFFRCPNCDIYGALDSLRRSFEERFGRPFDWPPGAPWPARRTCAGTPSKVPANED